MEQATQAELILFSTQSLLLAVDEEPVGQTLLAQMAVLVAAVLAIRQVGLLAVTEIRRLFRLLREIMVEAALLPVQPLVAAVAVAVEQVILAQMLAVVLVAMVAMVLFRPYQVLL